MSSLSSNPRCAVCYQPTSYWCSLCQQVWYCSAEHLQSDWPRHKMTCTPVPSNILHSSAVAPFSDSVFSVAAIYFPANEEKARLVTVNCMPAPYMPSRSCPVPLIRPWFPDGQYASLVVTQGLGLSPLRFPLQVWYDSGALSSGSPVNRSISRITSGKAARAWSGDVMVLRFSGSRREKYSSATMNDVPTLSAYFLGFK